MLLASVAGLHPWVENADPVPVRRQCVGRVEVGDFIVPASFADEGFGDIS